MKIQTVVFANGLLQLYQYMYIMFYNHYLLNAL